MEQKAVSFARFSVGITGFLDLRLTRRRVGAYDFGMNRFSKRLVAALLAALLLPLCFCSASAQISDLLEPATVADSCCSKESGVVADENNQQAPENCPCCLAHDQTVKDVPARDAPVKAAFEWLAFEFPRECMAPQREVALSTDLFVLIRPGGATLVSQYRLMLC